MSPNPFIRPLPAMQRIDLYAKMFGPLPAMQRIDLYTKMFGDAYAMLLNLYTNAHDHPCPLPMHEGIGESQPSSSSKGQVIDNAETDTGASINQNHTDSNAYAETLEEESLYDHDSTESNNPSLKHNTQETNVESGPCVYLFGPQDWLMHPSLYCKYMDRYLYMPLEVDSATILSSPGPSGVVNYVAPDLAKIIVEHIESYFSFDNLIHDVNFREHMDNEGWVPLPFIASLPGVRELTLNVKVIEEALKTSFAIEIKKGTKLIRHRHSWWRWISVSPKPYPATSDELINTSKSATNYTWRCAVL